MAQKGSPDYAASIPCALWSTVLRNCSENCQLVFLLTVVGSHRQGALDLAKQLWPAQTEQWAAQHVLRGGLAPKLAVSLPRRCTEGYLEMSSSQVLDVAKMQLFGWRVARQLMFNVILEMTFGSRLFGAARASCLHRLPPSNLKSTLGKVVCPRLSAFAMPHRLAESCWLARPRRSSSVSNLAKHLAAVLKALSQPLILTLAEKTLYSHSGTMLQACSGRHSNKVR